MSRIKIDEEEFLNIVRGRLRRDLVELLKSGQVTILGPDKGVAIAIDEIEIPHLRFSELPLNAETGDGGPDIGVGQGPGEPGDDLGPIDVENDEDGEGGGKKGKGDKKKRSAGWGRGHDIIELEISAREFFDLFAEVLQLPRIKPKGQKSIKTTERKYTDIRKTGPDSLRHKRRTFKNALKRSLSEGTYNLKRPRIIPIREDMRYRIPDEIVKPQNNAVIFYMMDVSGSVMTEDRALIRYFCRLSKFWLDYNYENLDTVWIIHDGEADRVSEEEFFKSQRDGGTVISSAHDLMLKIIDKEYPSSQWNIYPFYFSDGFNFDEDDEVSYELLTAKILPIVNQYTYGEVSADRFWYAGLKKNVPFVPAGSYGEMLKEVKKKVANVFIECVNLQSMADIPEAIRSVFKAGR